MIPTVGRVGGGGWWRLHPAVAGWALILCRGCRLLTWLPLNKSLKTIAFLFIFSGYRAQSNHTHPVVPFSDLQTVFHSLTLYSLTHTLNSHSMDAFSGTHCMGFGSEKLNHS